MPSNRDRDAFRLDHVALAVADIPAAARFLEGRLGGRPFEGGPGAGFRWGQWAFARGERLELIEPDGPPGGFLHRFLERHGPGVHHVTFKVPSLAEAAERARRAGYDVVGYDDSHPGWKEAFLHPKQAQGVVVQLAETHGEPESGPPPDWMRPPGAPDPPAPVRVVRLELAASSAGAARRQWEELLGGRCRVSDDRLRFAWPESPLGLAIRVEPETAPGPLALDVFAAQPLEIRDEARRLLGTDLRRVEHGEDDDG